MTRMSTALALTTLVMIGATVAIARTASSGNVQAAIDLQVLFDGGYIYRLGGKDAVEVITLKESKPHPHPMKVRVVKGSVSSGPSEIDLTNARLELWPDGKAPTRLKPNFPKPDTSMSGCDPVRDRDPGKKNNPFFLPNLAEAAAGMGTSLKPNPQPAASMLLTGGGDLSIDHVSGCVEYRDPDGKPYGKERSMASGVAGILYRWTIASARTLVLHIRPANGQPQSIMVTPDGGQIQLRVSSFQKPRSPSAPSRIDHFDTFDPVFERIDPRKKLSLWWLKAYEVSPGIDCPSGGDPGEPLAWP